MINNKRSNLFLMEKLHVITKKTYCKNADNCRPTTEVNLIGYYYDEVRLRENREHQ